jgi:hypothetical protein
VDRRGQLVVRPAAADPAELGGDGALRRIAAEQRRDARRVRGEVAEQQLELLEAAVAPEVAPLVCAPRHHRISIASPKEYKRYRSATAVA